MHDPNASQNNEPPVHHHQDNGEIFSILSAATNRHRAQRILQSLHVPDTINILSQTPHAQGIHRGVIAFALSALLYEDLLERVPNALKYAQEKVAQGQKIVLDHGALRTVFLEDMPIPAGHFAFARILKPLGYEMRDRYPLEKLKMCGFVYCHQDYPVELSQYFVSELYPKSFSDDFIHITSELMMNCRDPLTPEAQNLLQTLEQNQRLPLSAVKTLIPSLLACFSRIHRLPTWEEYKSLLTESAEMAWISTEGNAFNHATDRVNDIYALEKQQLSLGRPMKPDIEVAQNANIKQTAYLAAKVSYEFNSNDGTTRQEVPGSFFEFIERGQRQTEAEGQWEMDLRFDSKNAQGIFGVTKHEVK